MHTVFIALIDTTPYGTAIKHTQAHMVPLAFIWILDIVINLRYEWKRSFTKGQ